MPLVLALKNHESIVVASDTDGRTENLREYGQIMNLPGRTILLISGNTDAVRRSITQKVLPQITDTTSAAAVAQIIHAVLLLDMVPHLSELKGRVEIIIAGIDPVRHIKEPSIYYLDSARDFYLTIIPQGYAAAGATVIASELLSAQNLTSTSTDNLISLAKDCLASTKMRWPQALGGHIRVCVIMPGRTRVEDF